VDDHQLRGAGLRDFWRRRAVRILPAYWLAIIGALTVLTTLHTSPLHWASYLLLVQGYSRMPIDNTLSQMWTLAVEISFYAILPLLFRISGRFGSDRRRQGVGLVIGMTLAAIIGNVTVHGVSGHSSIALLWMPLYLDWFALGIVLALLVVHENRPARWQLAPLRWAQSTVTCWVVGGLLFWLSTLPLGVPRSLAPATAWQWTLQHELFGAAAFFLLLPLVVGHERWTDRLLGNRVATWFGEISYGVYLWHLGLLLAIQRWLGFAPFSGHFVELYLVTAASATVVAALSWHLVERPLLQRFSRSWRRPTGSERPRQDDADRHEAQPLHAGVVG
jgi:peptidoglycan/LPS O-acetylase OafA/YrhL